MEKSPCSIGVIHRLIQVVDFPGASHLSFRWNCQGVRLEIFTPISEGIILVGLIGILIMAYYNPYIIG